MQEKRFYNVGKLVNTQGLRGEVRVISTTDFPDERFQKGSELYLFHPSLPEPLLLKVATRRQQKDFEILSFEGYPSINDVEKFKGGELKVPEDALLELEEDEFYIHQLVGCTVVTDTGEELGKIVEVLQPGANDVWVVKGKRGEILLPFIDDCIKEVDIAGKRVVCHLMEGLL
ncbi:ribosome maturation factor RimM [Brevibacillus composti]|uniref:Ribosome maturation factor RimM n=1 Tax=Brevibacillus composti TaxID=2796470 RepID=A0A7T5JQ42_9BACL|nr:ribosome maturation factor RimM [Brevibacillus composti]QQE76093.1 ribosome maturation factor RimM [Brevibacillus composti]QUO43122.1 ribosome maturation factor RimM [Brevibacillus composti]